MELSADVDENNDISKSARYLAVQNLSAHKHEKELLFSGKRVKLKITNIILSGTKKGHSTELSVLNNIQKLLSNGTPFWTASEVELFQEYCRLRDLRYVAPKCYLLTKLV